VALGLAFAEATPHEQRPNRLQDSSSDLVSPSQVEDLVDAADALGPEAFAPAPEPPATPSVAVGSNPIAPLFDALKVERGSDGSLRIEASPEAASALASLFDGMARLLSAVAARPVQQDERAPPMPS